MRITVIGFLMILLVAASCSGQEPAAIDPPVGLGSVQDDPSTLPSDLAFNEPSSGSVEELHLGLTRPESFLPDEVSMLDQNAVIIADLLFDGLTEADPIAEELRPALASDWSHDAEFTQWTFTIANEAKVKPSTVVAHFQQLISNPPSGTTAFVLGSITSVDVNAKGDVVFELVAPNAGFAWMVSGLQFSVVGSQSGLTGRYTIESDTTERMVLAPISDGPRVLVSWTPDEFQAYDMMTLGQFDATVAAPDVLPDATRRYGADFEDLSVSKFFVLNPRSALSATGARREAFHLAIDQADLLDNRLPESIVSSPSILARSLTGYSEHECELVCQFDSAKAAPLFDAEVKAATIQVGVILPDQYGVGQEIVEDLEDAGLTAELIEVPIEDLTQAVFDGEIEIFSFGWIAGATSIDAVIPAVLGPSSPVEPSESDAAAIELLLAEAATTGSDSERWELLNQAHEEALSIGLILPISTQTHRLARSPKTKDLTVRADGSIDIFEADSD